MTWQQFNVALTPLIKKFGSYSHEEIRKGYFRWQKEPQTELLKYVDISLLTGQRLDLYQEIVHKNDKHPSREIWKSEPKIITDGYLDNILKENNAPSLLDLVFRKNSQPLEG